MMEETETLGHDSANKSPMPETCRCPVCGKWGRKDYSPNFPYGYLHCKKTARRGGKGCGEIFKYIKPRNSGCAQVLAAIDLLSITAKTIQAGYLLVTLMKQAGLHDPYRRKIKTGLVLDLVYSVNGKCACGCGKETPDNRAKYANSICSKAVTDAAWMLTNQDDSLRRFLVKLRGCKCEICSEAQISPKNLQIDHIIEVNECGGLCWIDNFQLACDKCHKAKTARYAKQRATDRKLAKIANSPQMSLF